MNPCATIRTIAPRPLFLAGTILASLLLAACLGPSTPVDVLPMGQVPTIDEAPHLRTLVHAADGQILSDSAYGGILPVVRQSFVDERYSWEPTIGVGPDGTAFYRSADDILGLPRGYVYRSSDHGETWQDVSPRLYGVVDELLFTGDPFLHVDPITGRVFAYDQQAFVVCDQWAISDDNGDTWETWNTCQEEGSYGDHPSITTGPPRVLEPAGYPNVVYFCASIGGESSCRVSLDGGRTYGPRVTSIEPCTDDEGNPGVGQHGHVRTGADGTVYVAKAVCNGARVGVSEDDGQTWRTIQIQNAGWTNQKWADLVEHEASVAADASGTIYVGLVGDDGLPKLMTSVDGGESWSEPRTISRPEITASNFVHLVAGDEGRIAVLYVGTNVPGGYDAPAHVMAEAKWHGYLAFSLNAHEDEPVFATTAVNPLEDPLRVGPCDRRCPVREGPLGRGVLQPGMYDFLDIAMDPRTGYVWVALVDLCHDECSRGTATGEEGAYAVASAGVQVGGTGLLVGARAA